jgi:hypothetical protein
MIGCPVGVGGWRGFERRVVGALDGAQAVDKGCFAGDDGLAVPPPVGAFGERLGLLPGLADAGSMLHGVERDGANGGLGDHAVEDEDD